MLIFIKILTYLLKAHPLSTVTPPVPWFGLCLTSLTCQKYFLKIKQTFKAAPRVWIISREFNSLLSALYQSCASKLVWLILQTRIGTSLHVEQIQSYMVSLLPLKNKNLRFGVTGSSCSCRCQLVENKVACSKQTSCDGGAV